jgi:hypothetical protein
MSPQIPIKESQLTDEVEQLLSQYKPLEDRVLAMVADIPVWNAKTVAKMFPNDSQQSVYRAIRKLVAGGRIRFAGWHGKVKQYTTHDVSNLPVIVRSTGEKEAIDVWVKHIKSMYKDDRWQLLDVFNEFPVALGLLFVAATEKDDAELTKIYRELLRRFVEMRTAAQTFNKWLDAILAHPIMSGDIEVFRSILTKEQLEPEDLNAFRAWHFKFEQRKESKNEHLTRN